MAARTWTKAKSQVPPPQTADTVVLPSDNDESVAGVVLPPDDEVAEVVLPVAEVVTPVEPTYEVEDAIIVETPVAAAYDEPVLAAATDDIVEAEVDDMSDEPADAPADDEGEDEEVPIEDYDELPVAAILPRLGELSPEELEAIREREELTKQRATVLSRVETLLTSPGAASMVPTHGPRSGIKREQQAAAARDDSGYWERYRNAETQASQKPPPPPLPEPSWVPENRGRAPFPFRTFAVWLLVLGVIVAAVWAIASNVDRIDDWLESDGDKVSLSDTGGNFVVEGDTPRERVLNWRDGGGAEHQGVLASDLTDMREATESNNDTAMLDACNQFRTHVQEARAYAPVPDARAQRLWTSSLNHYRAAANQCITASGDPADKYFAELGLGIAQGDRATARMTAIVAAG